jgi:hypothetical protein
MSRRVRRMWTVLATVAMTLGMTVGLATNAQAATYYEISNYKAQKCMSLGNGGSTANGTNVVIYPCNDGREQDWSMVESGAYPDYYYIKNFKAGSDQCISVDGASTANGAAMILWTCNGAAEQRWRLDNSNPGWFVLVNHKSGKVMSLAGGGSTANNTRVLQWPFLQTGYEALWKRTATIIDA